MKLKIALLLLLLSLLLECSMSVAGCSIEFQVVSMTDWRFQARWEGPWFRRSAWHWLKMGHAFDYHSWGSVTSCHGLWKLKILKSNGIKDLFSWEAISVEVPRDAIVTASIFGSDDDGYQSSYTAIKFLE